MKGKTNTQTNRRKTDKQTINLYVQTESVTGCHLLRDRTSDKQQNRQTTKQKKQQNIKTTKLTNNKTSKQETTVVGGGGVVVSEVAD